MSATFLITFFHAEIASSEVDHLLYVQQLEGVYTQSWFGQQIGQRDEGHEVYVRAEGKLGDFNGVLFIHCQHPQYSRWISKGGYLTPDHVPAQAIHGVRNLACDGG